MFLDHSNQASHLAQAVVVALDLGHHGTRFGFVVRHDCINMALVVQAVTMRNRVM